MRIIPIQTKKMLGKRPDCLELVVDISVSNVERIAPTQTSAFAAPPVHLGRGGL